MHRHYAEYAGYWETTAFLKEHTAASVLEGGEITFYDSNTGEPLFYAPRGRTFDEFVSESKKHGWPSFRDEEVRPKRRPRARVKQQTRAGTGLGQLTRRACGEPPR
jgi:hypothetical protein